MAEELLVGPGVLPPPRRARKGDVGGERPRELAVRRGRARVARAGELLQEHNARLREGTDRRGYS